MAATVRVLADAALAETVSFVTNPADHFVTQARLAGLQLSSAQGARTLHSCLLTSQRSTRPPTRLCCRLC